MLKPSLIFSLLILCSLFISAQPDMPPPFLELPEFALEKHEVESKLRFLASDELKGRRTGSPEADIAARFIAANLEAYGVQKVPGQDSYFQAVGFRGITPPAKAELKLHKKTFKQGEDLLVLTSGSVDLSKKAVVFAGHGWVAEDGSHDDYKDLDVRDKIVIVQIGTPTASDPYSIFRSMGKKRKMAAERGAVALFELYQLNVPWTFFNTYFGKETMSLKKADASAIPNMTYGFLNKVPADLISRIKKGKKTKTALKAAAHQLREIKSYNVAGVIPGRDPELKDEYIILSAHYDHVGTGANGGGAYTAEDSIFNGARDNAMGTTAILSAAQALSKRKPRRSILVLAFTGEEIGLLGSQYYAENPLLPLDKMIYNLNTDGAGYNDTTYISVVGYGRTGTDEQIEAGAAPFGLKVFPNPVPEQNLYDRSDNVSFAAKGIPSINIAPGTTAMDEQIVKYYHQVADNPETIDFDYLLKYCKAYSHIVRIIADAKERPWWKSGDKYEEAGNELYNR